MNLRPRIVISLASVLIAWVMCAGCASEYSLRWLGQVPKEVDRAWREDGSYYALLQIFETRFRNGMERWSCEECRWVPATLADVEKELDYPDFTAYPGLGTNVWVYQSVRNERGQYSHHDLIFGFNTSNYISSAIWVKERETGLLRLPIMHHVYWIESRDPREITVCIDTNQLNYLAFEERDEDQIERTMRRVVLKAGQGVPVNIAADRANTFGQVWSLVRACTRAGIWKLQFYIQKDDETPGQELVFSRVPFFAPAKEPVTSQSAKVTTNELAVKMQDDKKSALTSGKQRDEPERKILARRRRFVNAVAVEIENEAAVSLSNYISPITMKKGAYKIEVGSKIIRLNGKESNDADFKKFIKIFGSLEPKQGIVIIPEKDVTMARLAEIMDIFLEYKVQISIMDEY